MPLLALLPSQSISGGDSHSSTRAPFEVTYKLLSAHAWRDSKSAGFTYMKGEADANIMLQAQPRDACCPGCILCIKLSGKSRFCYVCNNRVVGRGLQTGSSET
jgi:hypothetical protein